MPGRSLRPHRHSAMTAMEQYFARVQEQMRHLQATQWAGIERAGTLLGDALAAGHWLYAFGTGHSHLLAEEIFYRAGGLARGVPILDPRLMLHDHAIDATHLERREGYAQRLLAQYPVAAGDVLIVASNSGRNAVPVELALGARARGLKVIAVTSQKQSQAWPSRHSSGKKLGDVADVVIDNGAESGDACVALAGLPGQVGPTSTITGALIVNLIIVGGMEHALACGFTPEIYISSNTNGDSHNDVLLEKYRSRIRHL
ncbi:MAG: SIS domain-containing protein [Verrucomicrobia bacterium]|nr:SIS domain-containing protein [Verrucomicrobiota bacterium]